LPSRRAFVVLASQKVPDSHILKGAQGALATILQPLEHSNTAHALLALKSSVAVPQLPKRRIQ
jgi:hypothetical protein